MENDEKDRKSAISNINFNRYVECNVNIECQLSTQTHSGTANHAVNIIIAQWSPSHDKPNMKFPTIRVLFLKKLPSKSVVFRGRIFHSDYLSILDVAQTSPACLLLELL